MRRAYSILTAGLAGIAAAPSLGALDLAYTINLRDAVANGSASESDRPTLSELRAARDPGSDLGLSPIAVRTPTVFTFTSSDDTIDIEQAEATDFEVNEILGPGISVRFDRSTNLRDGGIDGQRASLNASSDTSEPLASYADDGGEFDMYDMRLELDTLAHGPLHLSLIGGLKAVNAQVGQVTTSSDGSQNLEDGRGVVAVPVLGGGVRLNLGDRLYVASTATAQPYAGNTTMLDVTAETGLEIAPNIGLRAGYQLLQSELEVQSLHTQIDQQGIFARLVIEF